MKAGLIIAAGFIGWNALKKHFNPFEKIKVKFKTINGVDIGWDDAEMKVTISIGNQNKFSIDINDLEGTLNIGHIAIGIDQPVKFRLKPGSQVDAKFTVAVENDEFLLQLSQQIKTGKKPKISFDGSINLTVEEKTFDYKIKRQIPITVL